MHEDDSHIAWRCIDTPIRNILMRLAMCRDDSRAKCGLWPMCAAVAGRHVLMKFCSMRVAVRMVSTRMTKLPHAPKALGL